MSHQPSSLDPLQTPPPARRLNRLALGLGLSLGALIFVAGAMILTSQKAPQRGVENGPNEERSADAAFLNNPPRQRRSPDPAEENARIAALLRAAREPNSSSGPLGLGSEKPLVEGPGGTPALNPEGSAASPMNDLPQGVYRPFPSYSRVTLTTPPEASTLYKPSWQTAFSSSLVPASGAAPVLPSSGSLPELGTAAPWAGPASLLPGAGQTPRTQLVNRAADAPPKEGSHVQRGLVAASTEIAHGRTLKAGTILNAILLTSISSEMAGDAVAHLTSNVYSADGLLLLPKGTRLLGSYQNRVSLGKRRVAIAWDRLIVEGRTYDVPALPSTSPDGAAGMPGSVNHHSALVFGRAALLSVIGAGAQLGQPRRGRVGATLDDQEVLAGSLSQQLSQAAAELLNRAVDVEPTIHVPAGERLTVLLPYDLDLPNR